MTQAHAPRTAPAVYSNMARETMPGEREREVVGLALRSARKEADLSTKQAAEIAEISVPTLGMIERGDHSLTSLSAGNLSKLHHAFGLTWTDFLAIVVPVYGAFLPYLKTQYESATRSKPVDYDFHAPRSRQIVNAGEIGAGVNPRANATDHPVIMDIPDFPAISSYDDDDLMALTVTGDSMTCEEVRLTIPQGSTAIFHTSLSPQPGDVVAVWLENEGVGVLKIYKPSLDGHVILESYNKRHMPIILSSENPGEVQGVYVGHWAGGRRAHNRKAAPLVRN